MDNTDKYIYDLFKRFGIFSHDQLTIGHMSMIFDIKTHYWDEVSSIAIYKDRYKMFINENLNRSRQWQEFGHEMKHYFLDEGDILYLPKIYKIYQESKADYFAYHFCIPTFMLQKLKGVTVYDVMNLFNVEFEFALRRLEMYKNKVFERMMACERSY